MGNDHSSSTSSSFVHSKTVRTLIPLDDSSCWQLYNGTNDRSEPISIFTAKQTFSVECRRSIQFLKTVRHPNIIKFLAGFKTFVDQDSFVADCVHPLSQKLNSEDLTSNAKICLGLYQLTQGLEFLHEKAKISHNNVCLSSLYLSLNGVWKLGNFECACRYDNLNKTFLSSLKLIRAEECFTPEENDQNKKDFDPDEIYAVDVYGIGTLIGTLLTLVKIDEPINGFLIDLQNSLMNEEPQLRPKWKKLLQTDLFQTSYIKATELLDRLPTVEQEDLDTIVNSLSNYLDELQSEYFNELLIRRLLVPFMFLCSTTRTKLLPRILIPKTDENNSWISLETYRQHAIPVIVDLFSYHVTSIRLTLLEFFNSYFQFIDHLTLVNVVLPQLVYGLKDSNNTICTLTLMALAAMVPILGADVVVGGNRKQIFTDKIKKETVVFPKNPKKVTSTDSPVSTPPLTTKVKKSTPVLNEKPKPLRLKSTPVKDSPIQLEDPSPVYSNGTRSSSPNDSSERQSTTIVTNGQSNHQTEPEKSPEKIEVEVEEERGEEDDDDDDDGQWSDWEQPVDPPETSIQSASPPSLPSLPPTAPLSTSEQTTHRSSTSKSLQMTTISKAKWDPNAPLGSEYEIPPVVLSKKQSNQPTPVVKDEIEDFFKDMAPKVQTVELMRQLETMFIPESNRSEEVSAPKKSSTTIRTTTTTTASTFSSKFGMVQEDSADNQEMETGNNWDD